MNYLDRILKKLDEIRETTAHLNRPEAEKVSRSSYYPPAKHRRKRRDARENLRPITVRSSN